MKSTLYSSYKPLYQFVLHFSFSPFNIEIFFVFSFSQSSGWFIDNFMFLCFSIVVRQREIDWGLLLAIEVGNTMWTRYKASDFDVCRVIYDWFRSRLGFETPASDNWEQQGRDRSRGVYFVQKLYNCPKTRQKRGENFYNCPQFACCVQWNILKFAHFVPFVESSNGQILI